MKSFWYAKGTKIAIGFLLAVLAASAAMLAVSGMRTYAKAEEQVYRFETDFAHSGMVEKMLRDVIRLIPESCDANAQTADGRMRVRTEDLRLNLPSRTADGVEYLFMIGEETITNRPELSEADFTEADCNAWFTAQTGEDSYASSMLQLTERLSAAAKSVQPPCAVFVRLNPNRAAQLKALWNTQGDMLRALFLKLVILAVLFLAGALYLLRVCCRKKQTSSAFDRIWTEVRLAVFFGGCMMMVALAALVTDLCFFDPFLAEYLVLTLGGAAAFFGTLILEGLGLSLVRDLKNKTFLSHSILYRLGRRAWQWLQKAWQTAVRMLAVKSGALFAAMLLGYTVLLGFAGMLLLCGNALWILVGLAAFAAAFVLLCGRAQDLEAIKKAVTEIKNGQTDYMIPELKSEDYRQLADDIESIGLGLSRSVEAKLRAERMKTELITNVSHDLKTPLTSIINYTKLLQDLELSPQEAADYVNIIAQKSERLKQLTSDLFDIAKVQSGNEAVTLEKLDTTLLLQQSLAEYEDAFAAAGLLVQFSAEAQAHILADGKKMSRVVGNLLGNCVKYALSGTRVFISAEERNGKVVLEVKNTSAYPLDFDTDEITERFVRGSKSRTEEGNGLGLAIAKSYTEACGGRFCVETDGDLFKVQMEFDSV